MKIKRVCTICRSRAAEFSCVRCGRNICRVHYNKLVGLCNACGLGKLVGM